MRTIEEIKVEIKKAKDSRAEMVTLGFLVTELVMELTHGITLNRLEEICQAENGGRCVVLPCRVGDTVYKIPSKANYDLNIISGHSECNRVYKQKINEIRVYESGNYMLFTCDGLDSVHSEFYKINWFLTKVEAEAALIGEGKDD